MASRERPHHGLDDARRRSEGALVGHEPREVVVAVARLLVGEREVLLAVRRGAAHPGRCEDLHGLGLDGVRRVVVAVGVVEAVAEDPEHRLGAGLCLGRVDVDPARVADVHGDEAPGRGERADAVGERSVAGARGDAGGRVRFM